MYFLSIYIVHTGLQIRTHFIFEFFTQLITLWPPNFPLRFCNLFSKQNFITQIIQGSKCLSVKTFELKYAESNNFTKKKLILQIQTL